MGFYLHRHFDAVFALNVCMRLHAIPHYTTQMNIFIHCILCQSHRIMRANATLAVHMKWTAAIILIGIYIRVNFNRFRMHRMKCLTTSVQHTRTTANVPLRYLELMQWEKFHSKNFAHISWMLRIFDVKWKRMPMTKKWRIDVMPLPYMSEWQQWRQLLRNE